MNKVSFDSTLGLEQYIEMRRERINGETIEGSKVN